MNIPDNLKYTTTDEWVAIDGDVVTIGITDYAQNELTDIVYIDDFPDIGDMVEKGAVIAVVESVKAVADVMTPVAGEVIEINNELENAPESLNNAPYDAWIIKIRVKDPSDLGELLGPDEYRVKINS